MSVPKKTRPEAVLKALPPVRQDAIIDFLEIASIEELVKRKLKDGSEEEHRRLRCPSLLETVEWLAKDGVITSTRALSEWRSDYLLSRQMAANEAASLALVKEGRDQGWLKTAEQERAAGQAFFSRMAIAQQDPKMFVAVERLAVAKDQIKTERDKFEWDAAEGALRILPDLKEIAADNSLDQNAKIDAIRAKLFGQLPEAKT